LFALARVHVNLCIALGTMIEAEPLCYLIVALAYLTLAIMKSGMT
jgi:hypothetical protein